MILPTGSAPTEPRGYCEVEADALRLIVEGNQLEDAGRTREALGKYESAGLLAPTFARAQLNRGNALLALDDPLNALEAFSMALALDPGYASAHFNMGITYSRMGRLEEAVGAYRKVVESNPTHADAHLALAAVQGGLRRHAEAVSSYRRAAELDANLADAHLGLGETLVALEEYDQAVLAYRRAIALRPDSARLHFDLGKTLEGAGRDAEAIATYHQALAIDAGLADVHHALGNVHQKLGQDVRALEHYRGALATRPDFAEAYSNLGNVLLKLGHAEEAIAAQRSALAINPALLFAHLNLASAFRASDRLADAISSYHAALAIEPTSPEVYAGLGATHDVLGQVDEAATYYRRLVELDPSYPGAYSSLLFCLSHDESIDGQTLFAEHRRFGEYVEAPFRASWPAHRNAPDPDRRLEVGFVSGDFRKHAMANFIEPLITALARIPDLSLHAYSNSSVDDDVTHRTREHFDLWHDVAALSDAALAQKVIDDRIDILVDLSGITAKGRLLSFARKPAPIQAAWIGYLGTTGLTAMDYYFADRDFLPFTEFKSQFVEKLVHVPSSIPFSAEVGAPEVNGLPARANGFVTFGSFNRIGKIRPVTIAAWSRILHSLPEARLLLAALPLDVQRERLCAMLEKEGIAPDRLILHAPCQLQDYLALHHHVDICLDTFPYAGGVTNAHALWMGVPTLTLAGRTPVGRLGATLAIQVGLESYVATDVEDYVRKGLALASDLPALERVRTELRMRCEQMPNRRPEVVAAGFERAFRVMWKRWCAGLGPESFVVDA